MQRKGEVTNDHPMASTDTKKTLPSGNSADSQPPATETMDAVPEEWKGALGRLSKPLPNLNISVDIFVEFVSGFGFRTESMDTVFDHIKSESYGTSCQYRYKTADFVGRGRFGTVYEATVHDPYSLSGEPLMTVKVFHLPEDKKRLITLENWTKWRNRIQTVLDLGHKNLVAYHKLTILESRGTACFELLMEYCRGGDLAVFLQRLARTKALLDERTAVRYAADVAEGLHYLHQKYIIHGDLKPANVLRKHLPSGEDSLAICDLDDFVQMQGNQTCTDDISHLRGTYRYMSPEMLRTFDDPPTEERPGRKTDVWSLGCIILDLAERTVGTDEKWLQKGQTTIAAGDKMSDSVYMMKVMDGFVPLCHDTIPQALWLCIQRCLWECSAERCSAIDIIKELKVTSTCITSAQKGPTSSIIRAEATSSPSGITDQLVAHYRSGTEQIYADANSPQYPYHVQPVSTCSFQEYQVTSPALRQSPWPSAEGSYAKEMDEEIHKLLYIDEQHLLPSPTAHQNEISRLRGEVLTCLNHLAVYWIGRRAEKFGLERDRVDKSVFVRAFGSYGLGLSTSVDSDLNAVLIAPRFIGREDVFRGFIDLLKQQKNVKAVCPVENTFVPVIKFVYYSIEVDVTFAALRTMTIPDDAALLSDENLRDMDEKSVKSLNEWRVSRYLLDYVPDVQVFRAVLTFVKHWASQRLIYSNALGYLGGVSWAILVAYICTLNAGLSVRKHLKSFFKEFSQWNWPHPVNINISANPFNQIQGFVGLDAYVMPIITPCKPYYNSSFNVLTRTTLQDIRLQMKMALAVLRSDKQPVIWNDLLATRDPLDEYEWFLTITTTAKCESTLKRWRGVVESKLRPMLPSLERISGMKRCQIYPQVYRSSETARQNKSHCVWIIGIDYSNSSHTGQLQQVVREFRQSIQFYSIFNAGNDHDVTVVRKTSAKLRETLTVYAASDLKK